MTQFSKKNPFISRILEREKLNKEGSSKATYHIKLDLEGSHLTYKPGDALAIWPTNNQELVAEILERLGYAPETTIFEAGIGNDIHLSTFLAKYANLRRVTPAFLKEVCGQVFTDPKERLAMTRSHDIVGVLRKYPSLLQEPALLPSLLAPMLPRFYSIASAQSAHPTSVDLLVATFQYELNGQMVSGVGSDFLCDEGTAKVPLYIHPTESFTLPEKDLPLIMIGPGTGVAPYKGFLEERSFRGSQAFHWLFFGECNRAFDFYYESFFATCKNLTCSLAFSRDQQEKIYVQHKMYEEKHALYDWLQQGAIIYICGDAKRMAKDVVAMLHTIIEEEGGKTPAEAKECVKEMRRSKQLRMDVY